MSIPEIMEMARSFLSTALLIALPALAVSLVVGLVVSVLQTIMSIQEQTLSFVPKMAAILIGLVLLGRFLMDSLVGYTHRLFLMISNI